MTGAYLRVKRQNKWVNSEIEYLTDDERSLILGKETNERLLQWIALLSRNIREADQVFEQLEEEGIIERK